MISGLRMVVVVLCLSLSIAMFSEEANKPPSPKQQNQNQSGLTPQFLMHIKPCTQVTPPLIDGDFKKIRLSGAIMVDKSLMIKQVIDLEGKPFLIIRPRRFGKSLMFSMLYYFFNLMVDKEGAKSEKLKQAQKALFAGGLVYNKQTKQQMELSPLKISSEMLKKKKNQSYVDAFVGSHPTILLTFQNIKPKTYEQFENQMKSVLSKLFQQYQYLKKHLPQKEQAYKLNMFERLKFRQAKQQDIEESLSFLGELLFKYHNQTTVILLIDEYDSPLNEVIQDRGDNDLRRKIGEMVSAMIRLCAKGNGNVFHFVGLTGIYDSLVRGGNSGLNNMMRCDITDQIFCGMYGFTEDEIKDQLLSKIVKVENQNEGTINTFTDDINNLIKILAINYNGYELPANTQVKHGKNAIFNPFSVTTYLNWFIQNPKDYKNLNDLYAFSQSGSNRIIKLMFSLGAQQKITQKILQTAIAMKQIRKKQFFSIKQSKIQIDLFEFEKEDLGKPQCLLYFSFHMGYLTKKRNQLNQSQWLFSIPNLQVAKLIQQKFAQWAQNQQMPKSHQIDIQTKETFHNQVKKVITCRKRNIGQQNEEQGKNLVFLTQALAQKHSKHIYSSERKAGFGFVDALFMPLKDKSQKAILYEYKIVNSSQDQKEKYNEAMWQIYSKNYIALPVNQFISQSAKSIVIRALVFVKAGVQQHLGLFSEEEHIYSIEEANAISDFFSQQSVQSMINNPKLNTQKLKKEAKDTFLLKEQVKNLDQLLKKIIKNAKEKQPKINEDMKKLSVENKQQSSEKPKKQLIPKDQIQKQKQHSYPHFLTALIDRNPIQEFDLRMEAKNRAKIQKTTAKSMDLPFMFLHDPNLMTSNRVRVQSGMISLDQKLRNQAEFYERKGGVFESLRQALTDGIATLTRVRLIPFSVESFSL